ncbi:hypothetical protein V1389_04330 [Flavobacterium rakeshii]|uniref:hypothetical protein n=1 Tax=Flavobacterium rakeshii TaxID=1038845 RepID=UPI002E7B6EBF|nr:hypothetical protein [Flavobacterium rakeshii]MEE1897549.1 hypothetical protein [Flavobacterium rakeshii]
MKKFYLFLLFISVSMFASDIHKFKLNDNQKLESTYSGTINQSTFHSAIIKNKDNGNYEIITYYLNELQQTVKLDNTSFSFEPSIIAHHKYGDTLTVISHRKDNLTVIRYNLKSKTANVETIEFDNVRNTLSLADKTILISYKHFRKDFSITEISNAGIHTIDISVNENLANRYAPNFFLEAPVAITSLEFIENGPATVSKCYYTGNHYIVTKDNKYSGKITAMIVDIKSGNVDFVNYMNKPHKQKNITSFLSNGILFTLAGTKDNLIFKTFDLFTGEEGVFMELSNELSSFLPEGITTEEYAKEAKRGLMKPTLTVNKAGSNYAIRIDIVDTQSYQYDNYWFHNWMWNQNNNELMYNTQQSMRSSVPKFGPNPVYYDSFITNYKEDSKYAFTFFLDKNLTILKETNLQTDYTNPDKDKYLTPIFKNKSYKDIAPALTNTELRYICFDKKTGEIVIAGEKIENTTTTNEAKSK